MRKQKHLDVEWYLPQRKNNSLYQKRPFDYSTVATSDMIAMIAEETKYKTPNEILPLITYDNDAKRIMQGYIDNGFGDVALNIK